MEAKKWPSTGKETAWRARRSQNVTREAIDAAKAANVDCKVEMINEHPHDALITAGDKHDARMIVVGSHGDHPVVGAIIGATPYKLVQTSDRPVLVVRA
jgi:nucleotide-binding universal stress UspA family protein